MSHNVWVLHYEAYESQCDTSSHIAIYSNADAAKAAMLKCVEGQKNVEIGEDGMWAEYSSGDWSYHYSIKETPVNDSGDVYPFFY